MSGLKDLIPLVILFAFIGIGAFIGYNIYLWANGVADRGRKGMEKRNISFTKDGMKVGVKDMSEEEYTSKQQSYFVRAWNFSSMPAYKSRFWNREEQARQKALAAEGKSSSLDVNRPAPPRSYSSQLSPFSQVPPSIAQERPSAMRAGSNPGAFPDD